MRKFPFEQLVSWYSNHGRKYLPWRDYNHSEKELGYRIRLSEILLQQTQVSRGVEYFNKIIHKYPSVEVLADTSYEVFFEDYKGLGYYSRAKNMLKTAYIISKEYDGYFPKDSESLVELPGIGPYTAEAIRAFAFEIPTLSFDTNLEKIFSRYYYGNRFQELTRDDKKQILGDFVTSSVSAREFNNAAMDFGSLVSLNNKKSIDFQNYPIVGDKFAKTYGELEPEKKRKVSSFPLKEAIIKVILHENHKLYFSLNENNYTPFVLPPSKQADVRAYIKKYFKEKYGLELSVRPPHKKYYEGKESVIEVNAQVQKGKHDFFVFDKI